MFTKPYGKSPPREPEHKEGDLYKIITVHGRKFEIYYGYYEESDRYSKYPDPIEVFPDFIKNPVYTDDGIPFVSAIQDTCKYYEKIKDTTDKCADCVHFDQAEELIGICKCKQRRLDAKKKIKK